MALSDIIFLGITFALLILLVGVSFIGSSKLGTTLTTGSSLGTAQTYLKSSGYLAIVALLLVIIMLVLSFFIHFNTGHGKLIGIMMILLIALLVLVSGVLIIVAYTNIASSVFNAAVGTVGATKNLAIIGAITSFVIIILMIAYLITLLHHHPPATHLEP